MKQTEKEKRQQQYEDYVKKKTPVHNVYLNMAKAFLTGGIICVIGQGIYNYCEMIGLSKDHCSNWTSLSLILLSIILTGVGLYPKIAKWGGAGALVPITGFANSVAAPAIEYKKEGQVFGIGCKIFTISGPVILYGICTSSLLGLLYWIWMQAAPAIEYKKEGQVFGIGCKIFTISGPVILYGICTSSLLGLLYWIWMQF